MEISKVGPDEIRALHEIATRSFRETFAPYNSEEDMEAYLTTRLSEAQLKAELQHPESEFYFAVIDSSVAGYLKINEGTAQTEFKDDDGLEIERIYVLQAYQGRQIGHRLLEHALERAKTKGKRYVWLGVWEKNLKAIRFYERHGFVPFGKHTFMLGSDAQTDILMRCEIQ